MSLTEARMLAETNITPGQLLDVLARLDRCSASSQHALPQQVMPMVHSEYATDNTTGDPCLCNKATFQSLL